MKGNNRVTPAAQEQERLLHAFCKIIDHYYGAVRRDREERGKLRIEKQEERRGKCWGCIVEVCPFGVLNQEQKEIFCPLLPLPEKYKNAGLPVTEAFDTDTLGEFHFLIN